jgi:hypothetical protein
MIKSFWLFIISLFLALPAFADIDPAPLLNKVSLQLQADQWVTTNTALVYVGVNAAINDQGMGAIQNDVMNKLKQLSDKGDWHMIAFNRSLDQSGLERVQITAQARLPQNELSGLRDKAKKISKPGETYTIDNVAFTPAEDELQKANADLRNNLYLQAKAEIDSLNKIYPEQKYYLYSIDFGASPIAPAPMVAGNQIMMAKMAGASAPVQVGNKVSMQATVVIASFPDVILQKINH